MSKIIQLTTENVKRLRAVNIKPDGSLVIIGGRNAQGKSSVLDAIATALGGAEEIPSVPVRKGAESAKTVIDLGDMIVRRTIQPNGNTSLVIEDKEKKRFPSPQALLDSLTGRLTFDPLSFLAQKPKEQLESLKTLVGLDFTADDQERERTYSERTVVNREVERAQMTLNMAQHFPEVTGPADLTALNTELQEAQKHNEKLGPLKIEASKKTSELASAQMANKRWDIRRDEILADIETLKKKLADHDNAFQGLIQDVQKLTKESLDAQTAMDSFEQRDVKAVQQKLTDAHEQNRKHNANTARETLAKNLAEKKAESEKLTKTIGEIDERKSKKLSAAKFPVDGLSFGDGEVTFNGLPLSQASEAERYRVSVAMAAAMSPKIRVALVRNGSLLDKDNLELLAKLATEHDLQVWIERVGTTDPSAIIIEDGMVKGAQAPATEPAKEKPELLDLIP